MPRTLDLASLDQFLTFEYVIAPRTMLRGRARRCPPDRGCAGATAPGDRRPLLGSPPRFAVRAWTDEDADRGACATAAAGPSTSQLMSDVPLGAFLSGGIDSSALVALMSRGGERQPRAQLSAWASRTARYNELPYAREVATLFRTTHHREQRVTADLLDLFERLVPHFDEPFADVSLFPTYLVSQVARAARDRGAQR
jgi:asparagine synthase (glutamine-hydrolysing)